MAIWFNKKINGKKRYCSKSISLDYHSKHWKLISCRTNGATKGIKEDRCYDLNINILGIFFSYTNWDYNSDLNKPKVNTRILKINQIKKRMKYERL